MVGRLVGVNMRSRRCHQLVWIIQLTVSFLSGGENMRNTTIDDLIYLSQDSIQVGCVCLEAGVGGEQGLTGYRLPAPSVGLLTRAGLTIVRGARRSLPALAL
jgi:hypothetical protein